MVKYFQVINFTYLISNSFGIMHILIRLRDNGSYKLLKNHHFYGKSWWMQSITNIQRTELGFLNSLKIFNIIIYCNKHTEGDILSFPIDFWRKI